MKKLIWMICLILCLSVVAGLRYNHGETCDRPEGVDATPKFINKPRFGSKSVEQGSFVDFQVEVTGKQDGYAVCEVGIYYKSEVQKWYGAAYSIGAWDALTGNCVEGENFVITKRFPVRRGGVELVDYKVYIPTTYDQDNRFIAHVSCFNHCYLCSHDDFENYAHDTMDLKLTGNYQPPSNHCLNYVTDKDESDMDCGGSDCEKCLDGQRCKDDSDCAAGNCRQDNICAKDYDVPEPKPIVDIGGDGDFQITTFHVIAAGLVLLLIIVAIIIMKK